MDQIVQVDVTRFVLDLHRDLSVTSRATKPGPPERIDGVTIGFVSVTRDAPHKGEVHPDGDEILYVICGRLRVIGESEPNKVFNLGPGDACIVRKGEWHRVIMQPGTVVFRPCLAKFCEGVWKNLDAGFTLGAVGKITALAAIARVGHQNSRKGTCHYTA